MNKLTAAAATTALMLTLGAASAAAATSPCDDTDTAACMLPYPNNQFTKPSAKTPTKVQLNLPAAGMPANKSAKKIDPTQWNQLDGFSPGSTLITSASCLDPVQSNINGVLNPSGWANPDAGAIVYDVKNPTVRWPIFGEIDAQADSRSVADLLIRPLVNFTEGHTYAVVLRNIKDSAGKPLWAVTN